MLKLKDITKNYKTGETFVQALKGIDIEFRPHEFVSILGQSGCGKTTLLNIIGGLDKYSSGELTIDGVETKKYSDVDWDTYRNKRIGFVFQSYNLISHINILANVEMALTLSGVGREERKARAKKALEEVGLGDQLRKRPNQLSGGQMQRVSIARALINNPTIILADEPTGALDSATSVQIMETLKLISETKLVIMVTHNPEIADQYSTRIIKLRDGMVTDDSNPFDCEKEKAVLQEMTVDSVSQTDEKQNNKEQIAQSAETKTIDPKSEKRIKNAENKQKKNALKKSSMTWWTAIKLSFQNLLTKKGRTTMTAIAGSIGIIGVALVLAISNGMNGYILNMQKEVLANYPIQVSHLSVDTNKIMEIMMGGSTIERPDKFPPGSTINPYDPFQDLINMVYTNTITKEYIEYVSKLQEKGKVDQINYSYGIDMPVFSAINKGYFPNEQSRFCKVSKPVSSISMPMGGDMTQNSPDIGWQQMTGGEEYILGQYNLLAGHFPKEKNQVALVIDKSNQVSKSMLASLGLSYNSKLDFEDIIGSKDKKPVGLRLPINNAYYQFDDVEQIYKTRSGLEIFQDTNHEDILDIEVVAILRQDPNAKVGSLGTGIAYTQELTKFMLENSAQSDIVNAQKNNPYFNNRSVLTGELFPSALEGFTNNKAMTLELLGGSDMPNIISIYPKDFDTKEYITSYLTKWNTDKLGSTIKYSDMSQFATDIMSQTVRIVSIALICFAAVSLLVSSVMIGIITYVSVVERTKEIGILRSLGARKRDITNVFNAETSIIGFAAGLIGVLLTFIASVPINAIIFAKTGINNLCILNPLHALMLVAISMALTIVAGLIPSFIASKRDPVIALRTE